MAIEIYKDSPIVPVMVAQAKGERVDSDVAVDKLSVIVNGLLVFGFCSGDLSLRILSSRISDRMTMLSDNLL